MNLTVVAYDNLPGPVGQWIPIMALNVLNNGKALQPTSSSTVTAICIPT